MKWIAVVLALYASALSLVQCQDYAEYARGAGIGRRRNNRGPILAAAAGGVVGAGLGVWLTSYRLNSRFKRDTEELTAYLVKLEEVNKAKEKTWQQEYRKLYKAYEELEKDTVERDYEEFKAPDTNNDDKITKAEFDIYVRKYLSSFPELSEKDFPKFEEFDLDGDGIVSFDEWQNFLYLQKEMEKQKAEKGAKTGTVQDKNAYNDLLSALYDQSHNSDSFGSLNKQIAAGARGKGNNARRAV